MWMRHHASQHLDCRSISPGAEHVTGVRIWRETTDGAENSDDSGWLANAIA
jgi:hypothetical protein